MEMLAVMAVMGIVASVGIPAVSGLTGAGNATRAVTDMAGVLDMARQYAVARNTYTWVVVTSDPDGEKGPSLYVTILGSRDGTNTFDGVDPMSLDLAGNYDLAGAAGNLEVLQKMQVFKGIRLTAGASAEADPLNSNISFKFAESALRTNDFLNKNPGAQRAIQFGPTGQPRVSGSMSQKIEMGFQLMHGNMPDDKNIATLQINGFTGQTRVVRL